MPEGHTGREIASVNSFGYGGTNCHVVLESVAKSGSMTNGHGSIHTNGQNGTNGAHANGVNGSNGVKHTNGTNGTNGINGTNGTNGINGTNGTNGSHHATESAKVSNGEMNGNRHSKVEPELAMPRLFVLSGATDLVVEQSAKSLQRWLESNKPSAAQLGDLSYTLADRRTHHAQRLAFVAATAEELQTELAQAKAGKGRATSNINISFVFTGQGAQWFAMGRELIGNSKIFRDSLKESDRVLAGLGCEWSLVNEFLQSEEDSQMGKSEISQPATTALQIALVDMLFDLGIRPRGVVGHSSGEIAAAYCAGALGHAEAVEA